MVRSNRVLTLVVLASAGIAAASAAERRWGPFRGANTPPTITEEDVRDFAAMGGNLLRVVNNTRPLMDKKAPFDLNETNLAQLDRLIGYCEKYKVRMVIDPHTTPGTDATTTTRPTDAFWSDFAVQQHLLRLWDHLAHRYASRGEVIAGYDLLNEPGIPNGGAAGTPADWNLLVRKLVKTIRAVDKTHTIIIEPPTIRTPEGKGINRLLGMSYLEAAPDPNVVYSPHMYEPHEFTHQGVQKRSEPVPYPGTIRGKEWNRKAIEEALQPVVDFQSKRGAAIFMGEFSAPRWRGDDANRYLRDVIEVCEAHGWSWAYHAYREWEGWDAERSNTEREDRERKASTPRLELLKSFFARNTR
jgi:endoglucanase